MKKVTSDKSGIIHAFAQCSQCSWDAAINISDKNRMNTLRSKIVNHVRKTGHEVVLETGNCTTYKLEV
jgi:hypothetical protein